MNLLRVAGVLIVLGGLAAAGFGLAVGDQASYSLSASGPVEETDERSDLVHTEYDVLSPEVQDAFRRSLATDEFVRLGTGVESAPQFDSSYVQYRGQTYETLLVHGDGGMTTMVASIGVGMLLVVVGLVSWRIGGQLRVELTVERVGD